MSKKVSGIELLRADIAHQAYKNVKFHYIKVLSCLKTCVSNIFHTQLMTS